MLRKLARTRKIAFVLLTLIGLGCAVSGCATDGENPFAANDNSSAEFQAGENRPPTAKTLYAMARILDRKGQTSEAKYTLKRIIREYPDFLPAYNDLGEIQMRETAIDQAIETLSAGLRLAPNDPVLINNLGMCYLRKAEYEQAKHHFTKAAGIVPEDSRYRSNMAVALGMMGHYDESLALFMQILPPADAYYNLGVVCEAKNDQQQAAKAFSQASALRAAAEEEAKAKKK